MSERASKSPDALPRPAGSPGGVSGVSSAVTGSGVSSGGGATPSGAGSAGSAATSTARGRGGERSQFDAFELAIILSHYDIGPIATIKEFPRGSRRAPKLLLRSDKGRYLLKRRARGRDEPDKVAFCHAIQLHLAERQFPLPHLIGTRRHNNSMLQWEGRVYELFEYIKGTGYDGSLEATHDSGRVLALFHKLLAEYEPEHESARGTYHNARGVFGALEQLPAKLREKYPDADTGGRVTKLAEFLHASYRQAAERVEQLGLAQWPQQIVHSDWHPGNMLFRGSRVVAVIDYDSARLAQRVIDVANGALQFSITSAGDDPNNWPEYLDETSFKRFLIGYDSVYQDQPAHLLSSAELVAIPWLMIEALIAESSIPVAATGSFSYMSGLDFLFMVERKVRWFQAHADDLAGALDA